MTKRGLVNWAIWISVISGIYCAIYAVTIGRWAEGVTGWHVMCGTFTALPIYFISGAKRKDWLSFVGSNIVGVLWGMLYLFCMDRAAAYWGWPWWLNAGVVIGVLCTIECAIHFCLPSAIPINVVPAQFGGISNTFWTSNLALAVAGPGQTAMASFYNFSMVPMIMATLVGGVCLGLFCNEGLNFINAETGRWQWPTARKKVAA